MTDSITTFVTFDMPAGAVEEFKTTWLQDAAFIATQPGQKGGALFRRSSGDKRAQFVNVAHWESEEALVAALHASIAQQARDGRDQGSLFKSLGVSINTENYRVDHPY